MAAAAPCIHVLAGTNGAGKSSIAGAAFRHQGSDYFNPDEAARQFKARNPALSQAEANGAAWQQGKRLLERAIAERLNFAFETTLGGRSITRLLQAALAAGLEVRVWYAGLDTAERHIARVRQRVRRGGHDIPEATIRQRFDQSRLNLIQLLPHLTELRVYDNSTEADPQRGLSPQPRLILHTLHGKLVGPRQLARTPAWAKPLVAAALTAKT